MKPKLIGAGAAKLVYIDTDDRSPVAYCIANHFWDKKELMGELHFSKKLREILKQKGLSDEYLAISLELSEQRLFKSTTIKMPLAQGNFEDEIQKANLPFQQRLNYGLQFLKGLTTLHATGYVHGDLKLTNLLVFKTKEAGTESK